MSGARRRVIAPILTTVLAVVIAASGAAALAGMAPVPLRPPSGYGDYCEGIAKTSKSPCSKGGVPQALWRSLALPAIAPNGECPTSELHVVTHQMSATLGAGPVYFSAGAYNARDRATMAAEYPSRSPIAVGTGWAVAKTTLVMRRSLREPLVVRGRRLDGAGQLGFSGPSGQRPIAAIQFAATAPAIGLGAYKARGINVWATSSGCYGLQVDGASFTRVVVFRVELTPPPNS